MTTETVTVHGKFGPDFTTDRTERTALKEHPCSRCRAITRRVGLEHHARPIEPGESYVESYGLGEPFNPARYHLTCWDEEMAE